MNFEAFFTIFLSIIGTVYPQSRLSDISSVISNSSGLEDPEQIVGIKQPDPVLEIWIIHSAGFEQKIENFNFSKVKEVTLNFIPVSSRKDAFYQLRCNAKYPIEVRYEGEGTPQVNPSSYRRFNGKIRNRTDAEQLLQDEELNYFEVRVNISVHEGNTGNYICQGLIRPYLYLDSKLYLYIPGRKIFIGDTSKPLGIFRLRNDDSAINEIRFNNHANFISENPEDKEALFIENNRRANLIIPCAISSPSRDIEVTLFEDFRNKDGSITSKNISSVADFYPKQGFILKQFQRFDTPKEFHCSAFNSSKTNKKPAYISFIVKPWIFNTTTDISYELNSPQESIQFNCTVSPKNLNVFFGRKNCYSEMDCKFLVQKLRKTNLPKWMGNSENGIISLTYKQFPALPEFNHTDLSHQMLPLSGVFFCSCGRNRIQFLIYNFFVDNLVTEFEDTSDQTLQIMADVDENSPSVDFRCVGNAFYYSRGFRWGFEMNDGRFHFLHGEEVGTPKSFHIENKIVVSSMTSKMTSTREFRLEDIKSVTCYAPKWNSFGWDNTTIHPMQEHAFSHAFRNQLQFPIIVISQFLLILCTFLK